MASRSGAGSGQTEGARPATNGQNLAALRHFEAAARFFQNKRYDKAREIFDRLAKGPISEVADRARVYLRLCEQRLESASPAPKTSEGYYDLGVAELNARRLDLAIEHLTRANKLMPNHEHVRYALAAAHALQGNSDAALEHLEAAIKLRSGNRFQARYENDFKSLEGDPRFRRLLFSELN